MFQNILFQNILCLVPGIVLAQSEYYYNHWCQAYGNGV